MRRETGFVLWVLVGILAAAGAGCSDQGVGFSDGGPDGGGAADGTDAQSDEGIPPDLDIGDGFGVWVPEAAFLCSLGTTRDDLPGMIAERQHATRIRLRSGLVKLPRDGQVPGLAWIETGERGPDHQALTPSGSGTFQRSVYDGVTTFEYREILDAGGRPMEFGMRLVFRPGESLLVLQGASWRADASGAPRVSAWSKLEEADGSIWWNGFTTCDLAALDLRTVQASLQGGASLEIRFRCPDFEDHIIILSTRCPCLLESARYRSGADERTAADFFEMVNVSWNHCNFSQATLARWSEPLGSFQGIYVAGGPSINPTGGPTEVQFLDSNLQVAGTLAVTSWVMP